MLWKRLYGDNIWAHTGDELEGLLALLAYLEYEPFFTLTFSLVANFVLHLLSSCCNL